MSTIEIFASGHEPNATHPNFAAGEPSQPGATEIPHSNHVALLADTSAVDGQRSLEDQPGIAIDGTHLTASDHLTSDSQDDGVAGSEHHQPGATDVSLPTLDSLPADHSAISDQEGRGVQRNNATDGTHLTASDQLASDQLRSGSQDDRVAGSEPFAVDGHYPRVAHNNPAIDGTHLPSGQKESESHYSSAAGGDQSAVESPNLPEPHDDPALDGAPLSTSGGWMELRIWAEMFEDAQKARIAATNRVRGGVDRTLYAAYIESLRAAEDECGKAMRQCLKRVVPQPILDWQEASAGIGDHLLARLLGSMGHPLYAFPHHWEGTGSKRALVSDPPFVRTVGQLWQFCGHGAPSVRKRGMSVEEAMGNGSPRLKMLVHLLAESSMKIVGCEARDAWVDEDGKKHPRRSARDAGLYRLVYEQFRGEYADRTHSVECVRCGPSGKPAQPGSPWSPGHQNAMALRKVGKEILRDLWVAAHEGE